MPSSKFIVRLLGQAAEYFRSRSSIPFAAPSMTEAEAMRDTEFAEDVGALILDAHDQGLLPHAGWLAECISYHTNPRTNETKRNARRIQVRCLCQATYVRCRVNLFYDIVGRVYHILFPQVQFTSSDSYWYFQAQAATCDIISFWVQRTNETKCEEEEER